MTVRPLLVLLLLGACAAPPPQTAAQRETRALTDACRTEADRVVRYRDRGQTMRHDDYNARIGTTDYLGPQVITDQIAQVYDRDRIAAECVRGSREAPATAAPTGAPAPGGRAPRR
ncbi:hypothetical protein [Muricoccus radiodurans]|uniref:hypothetical protein n=1 Tax=Muricoccus radiodurans TaxID=2231721 RepID=UPI003CE7D7B0